MPLTDTKAEPRVTTMQMGNLLRQLEAIQSEHRKVKPGSACCA